MKTVIVYSGKSDVGKRRSSNQDQFLIAELGPVLRLGANGLGIEPNSQIFGEPIGYLLMVADGMGGHQGGNRASELVVREIAARITGLVSMFSATTDFVAANLEASIKAIVEAAHRAIVQESAATQKYAGMGTTLTLAIVAQGTMLVAHVGDSRCYRIRAGSIQRLTADHTVANQMASRSGLSEESLENSPWSNVLWNAVGASSDNVQTDMHRLEVATGDRYVLCSDGLNKHVSDAEILRISSMNIEVEETCNQLLQAALDGGGSDNVTAIVFDVIALSEESQSTKVASISQTLLFHEYANDVTDEFDTTSESARTDADVP